MSSSPRNRVVTLACAVVGVLVVGAAPHAQRDPVRLIPGPSTTLGGRTIQGRQAALAHFRGLLAAEGQVRVIVEARTPVRRSQAPMEDLAESRMLSDARQRVIRRLPPQRNEVREFDVIPFFALVADAATFDVLLSDPNVVSIQEDFQVKAHLAKSVPLVQAALAWKAGFTGKGKTVAILDTGTDKVHPYFGGRVTSEACYSGGGLKADSYCKSGALSSTAAGSGAPCTPVDQCAHGTHVASIAAGSTGVAKEASIIAMQIFSKSPDGPVSWSSDMIKGLTRVYALRSRKIAAVNLSIGSGGYTETCDDLSPAAVAIVAKLTTARIAAVAASGNDGFIDAISWPACMTKVISVGNTTKSNKVTSSSNSTQFLNLLAPGTAITAAYPDKRIASMTGTSMAAPHVAGAWALLAHKKPTLTVAAALAALQKTGLSINDTRNGFKVRRISINSALTSIK
ncbi:MAG: S8 family serine peptidase [Acidobacteriota bacterium]|nr:S8 family serine peptidase [Acidobacteriota bacterium]